LAVYQHGLRMCVCAGTLRRRQVDRSCRWPKGTSGAALPQQGCDLIVAPVAGVLAPCPARAWALPLNATSLALQLIRIWEAYPEAIGMQTEHPDVTDEAWSDPSVVYPDCVDQRRRPLVESAVA
jgi:hypothetical protein